MSTTYVSYVDTENVIWRCETCGTTAKENQPHYRYGPYKPGKVGGSGDTAYASIGTRDMLPCGPMKRGRWVADEGDSE